MSNHGGVVARRAKVLRPRNWLPLALVLATSSCGSSEAGSGDPSAGPRLLDTLPRVALSDAPTVTIGRNPEADEYILVGVRWAALSGDTLLVIGDAGADRVGAYGLDGIFRRWIGGVGEGPGEFRSPAFGGLTARGDVWVSDRRRVLVYSPSGDVLRTITLPLQPPALVGTTVLGVDSESGVWVRKDLNVSHADRTGVDFGERYRTHVTFRRVLPDSSFVAWEGEGGEEVYVEEQGGRGSRSGVLAPRLHAALMLDELVLTRTESSSVDWVAANGTLTRSLEYTVDDVPIGDRYPRAQGLDRYEVLPRSIGLFPGEAGSAWLYVQHPRHPFDSIAPLVHLTEDGFVEYLDAEPPLVRPFFVGDRYSVWRDFSDLGEQLVSVHELIR